MGVLDSIPDEWLAKDPSKDLYPQCFSPSCKDIWDICVTNVLADVNSTFTYEGRWNACISAFVNSCYAERREPFAEPAETVNDTIFEDIKSQYRDAILFLTKIPCDIKEKGKPKCFITDTGFYISLKYTFSSTKSNFKDSLLQIGVVQNRLGYDYTAPKGASITFQNMQIDPDTDTGDICVTLFCDKQPVIADNYTPSQSQLSSFILSVIFDPIKSTSNPLRNL